MKEMIFGLVAGIVAAMGMGGGTILILLLNLFGNVQQHRIQGINLVFFIPTSIIAICMNVRHKIIDYQLSMIFIFSGILGAICGSLLSFKIDNAHLKRYFGIFLMIIVIFQIFSFFREYRLEKKENNKSYRKK